MRSTGLRWDLRKSTTYEKYTDYNFVVPYAVNGDCYDRYLIRMEEMIQSNIIMSFAINKMPEGYIKSSNYHMTPPSKIEAKTTIQGLIFHFMYFSNNLPLKKGEVYVGVEAPKGEFGVFLVSEGSVIPYRCKIRSPGYFHLQAINYLSKGLFLADVVTIIGSLDIVFGEIDR